MIRPITLMSAQWEDMSFEDLCALAAQMGYDGIEISCGPHFDPVRAARDSAYCDKLLATLESCELGTWAIACHDVGHCVGSSDDPNLPAAVPSELAGKPDEIRQWAVDAMMAMPLAAANMHVSVVTGFMGSVIWPSWYPYPHYSADRIDEGFALIRELWDPILQQFDRENVRFAVEVHPTETAFDYYTAERLLEEFEWRDTIGINFDPSHLEWQGINPVVFIRDFAENIYHVHFKDVAVTLDGRAGLLGSFLRPGNTRRGWNFRTPGHGDINFEDIIRELNAIEYEGPISVEWEDPGMERTEAAAEACEFVRQLNFEEAPRSMTSNGPASEDS